MGYFTEYTLESLIDRYVILEQQLIFFTRCCYGTLVVVCFLWAVGRGSHEAIVASVEFFHF